MKKHENIKVLEEKCKEINNEIIFYKQLMLSLAKSFGDEKIKEKNMIEKLKMYYKKDETFFEEKLGITKSKISELNYESKKSMLCNKKNHIVETNLNSNYTIFFLSDNLDYYEAINLTNDFSRKIKMITNYKNICKSIHRKLNEIRIFNGKLEAYIFGVVAAYKMYQKKYFLFTIHE